jgi:hypothetical protein
MVRSIRRAWDAASADDLAAGLSWYATANGTARALAAGTDGRVSLEQAAGVIAALSPRMQWGRNVRLAALVVDAHGLNLPMPGGVFRRQLDTACAILDGRLDGPTGPKVSAFYRAILGDHDAVVVDVWAARAAGLDMPDGTTISPAQYRRIAAAYRSAAAAIGTVSPRDLQAAVWVATRGRAA